jgi:CO/xanthine dehydrogenase FAD-binding subunit
LLYELPVFQHVDAKSVKEAVSCLYSNGEKAKVIAGGTDLLALMKDRVEGARPLPMNGYKIDLTRTLVRRALTSVR